MPQTIPETPSYICEECGSTRYADRSGYRWCVGCGVGEPIFQPPHKVPGHGNDVQHTPEHQLAYGKNLGNPAVNSRRDRKALFDVLAMNTTEDLGIRAIQIRSECMNSMEPPITRRMKNLGSALCRHYGYGDNLFFSNALGFNLKWIGSILTARNDGRHSKDLTIATFVFNVHRFDGWSKAVEIMFDAWVNKKTMKIDVSDSKNRYIAVARSMIGLSKLVI
jgi:hypothetical protein